MQMQFDKHKNVLASINYYSFEYTPCPGKSGPPRLIVITEQKKNSPLTNLAEILNIVYRVIDFDAGKIFYVN